MFSYRKWRNISWHPKCYGTSVSLIGFKRRHITKIWIQLVRFRHQIYLNHLQVTSFKVQMKAAFVIARILKKAFKGELTWKVSEENVMNKIAAIVRSEAILLNHSAWKPKLSFEMRKVWWRNLITKFFN